MRIWELAVAPTRFAGKGKGTRKQAGGDSPTQGSYTPRRKGCAGVTVTGGSATRDLERTNVRKKKEFEKAQVGEEREKEGRRGTRKEGGGLEKKEQRGDNRSERNRKRIRAYATAALTAGTGTIAVPHRNEKPPKREALTKNEEENKGGHTRTNEERETDRREQGQIPARRRLQRKERKNQGLEGMQRGRDNRKPPISRHRTDEACPRFLEERVSDSSRVRRRCDEQHGMRRIEAQRRNNTSTKAWTHGPKARRRPVQRRLIIITDRENRRIEGMDVPEKYHLISPFDSPPNNIDTDMGPETWRKRKERNNEGRAPLMPGRPS
ncbi:hypothetical protein C8R44DRAFT_744654 [Mycena epipterygia]|nr:hypothetical protein C8R44DRAFT_744654 [Mycena epipterygia]